MMRLYLLCDEGFLMEIASIQAIKVPFLILTLRLENYKDSRKLIGDKVCNI